ncbi:MAG: LacI family DNA-binding transcriptional regulator [Lachnospiraceae bacterium]|nr:LacI family DNA-binding transcriptional regulator [Lachnospiraceae bacterium]
MITIKEIASQLGMSTTTVSNVIHGKIREVSPATIERVQKFLKEVDYVPNINARNLALQRSKMVGVVLKAPEDKYVSALADPFVSVMLSSIEKTLRGAGYYMMVYISDDIAEILKNIASWNVDGLILFYMLDDDASRVSAKFSKPIVCIDAYYQEDIGDFYVVGLDDENAAYHATRYLIENGHTRIGYLCDGNEITSVNYQRFHGYRRALKDAGLEYSDRCLFLVRPEKEELLKSLGKICDKAGNVTAVFCMSDLYAKMLICALTDRGIRVPDDVSVIGFDDNLYAQLSRPGLTTVHQDVEKRGTVATQTLLNIIAGNPPAERRIEMKSELVIRDTVCRAN